MSREIKFRGQHNGEWIYGYYAVIGTRNVIIKLNPENFYSVDENLNKRNGNEILDVRADTVGQYIGVSDKNRKEIYEGDICKYYNSEDKDGIAIIREDYAEWIGGTIHQKEIMTPLFYLKCSEEWEVIGNVYENADLLKEADE